MCGNKSILNRILAILSVIAIMTTFALAQGQPGAGQQQSTKGAVIKGKAPVSKEVLKVKFPQPAEIKLSNGVRVYVLENHRLPVFSMQMVFPSGGINDPSNQVGAAQYTAQLLREGTKTRSSKDIAEQIEGLGATLNASSGLSSLTSNVSASGLTDNFDKILELFSDVILNPIFPEEEFNKLKTRSLASLRSNRAQPGFLANEKFSQVMYGNHPAARTSVTEADWNRLSTAVLKNFHSKYYIPNNAIFAISGDVNPKDVAAKLEKAFAGWKAGEAPTQSIPAVGNLSATKIYLIDRPGSVQTNLLFGTLTIERNDPDYPALQVMDRVIGGGPASRLFLNLREDKGYTYGAYSSVSAYKYRGTFTANTEVRTDVTDGSMKELFYEMKRIRDEKVPDKELEDAKRSIVGIFALQLESPQALLNNFVMTKIYNLGDDYWNTYPQKIAAITADDVQRVARKYLDLDHLQIVAVGDGKKIIEALKKYGSVDIFDTEGKSKDLNAASTGTPSGPSNNGALVGSWNLNVKTPDGDTMTLKAIFKLDGSNIVGSLESPMGNSQVTSGGVKGNDVDFKAVADIQGQKMNLQFTGKLNGGELKGAISVEGAPFPPLEVSGTKQQ